MRTAVRKRNRWFRAFLEGVAPPVWLRPQWKLEWECCTGRWSSPLQPHLSLGCVGAQVKVQSREGALIAFVSRKETSVVGSSESGRLGRRGCSHLVRPAHSRLAPEERVAEQESTWWLPADSCTYVAASSINLTRKCFCQDSWGCLESRVELRNPNLISSKKIRVQPRT